ncbi:glycosyltransferase family A protein [uncultured Polaribacter sp.]|uniref:glycosyltransferase family 2 protein n=1 Tax=uncultured Polaribacter sp. TaxID=174711 RepID=UPI00262D2EC3|nr:glycosyltransferase family A protein [uncultured Polaribacter sp.]
MIILYHLDNEAIEYEDTEKDIITKCSVKNIQVCLILLSKKYNNALLVWCHQSLKQYLNKEKIYTIFHHKLILASYSTSGKNILSKDLGFVDQHCFINVKRNVTYPTWLMSSDIGGLYSNVLIKYEKLSIINQSFSEFLCSLAKINMPKGLLCYSEPKLLLKGYDKVSINNRRKNYILYKFVKRHYKIQWIFILFINQLIFKNKFPLISLVKSLFVKKETNFHVNFSNIIVQSSKEKIKLDSFKVDVLIPTLGRKEHLYNVLKDFSKQTLLPQNIIIVEQNGDKNGVSELDFLNENWPFKINHTFIHQLGACNARNIALSRVTGNWVFFADDDVRFNKNLLYEAYKSINKIGLSSFTFSCLQENEYGLDGFFHQWNGFGTNASIVKSEFLAKCNFKTEHEFGYGEDSDFGMQLRNIGCDNIYLPSIKMLHLKAPIGGFRFKFKPNWENEEIKPKPSPTVMAYNLKHLSVEQIKAYKFLLFVKFYKNQSIKNPFSYLKAMRKRWNISVKWATKLINYEV